METTSAADTQRIDMKLYGEFVPGTDSWVSLSVMNTNMKLNGKSIPLPTDQRFAVNLFFTDYFREQSVEDVAEASHTPTDSLLCPTSELETNVFRAPAYKRADIELNYLVLNNEGKSGLKGFEENLGGIGMP